MASGRAGLISLSTVPLGTPLVRVRALARTPGSRLAAFFACRARRRMWCRARTSSRSIFLATSIRRAPWKDIFTAQREISSLADRSLQARVVDPQIWWKLPTAIVATDRVANSWGMESMVSYL